MGFAHAGERLAVREERAGKLEAGVSRAKSSMMPTAVSGFTSPSSTASCSFVESSKVSTTGLFPAGRSGSPSRGRPPVPAGSPRATTVRALRGTLPGSGRNHRLRPPGSGDTSAPDLAELVRPHRRRFPRRFRSSDHRLGIRALRRYRTESRRLGESIRRVRDERIPEQPLADPGVRRSLDLRLDLSRPVRDTEREVLEPPGRCALQSHSLAAGSRAAILARSRTARRSGSRRDTHRGPSGMGRASARCSRRSRAIDGICCATSSGRVAATPNTLAPRNVPWVSAPRAPRRGTSQSIARGSPAGSGTACSPLGRRACARSRRGRRRCRPQRRLGNGDVVPANGRVGEVGETAVAGIRRAARRLDTWFRHPRFQAAAAWIGSRNATTRPTTITPRRWSRSIAWGRS